MKDVPKLQITFYFFVVILFAYCLYLIIYSGEFLIGSDPSDDEMIFYVGFRILAGVFFFAAAYYLPRLNLNIKIIFTAGLIARVLLIPTNPVMEDDYNRYLWDGAVTANAVNPYRYAPKEIANIQDADDRNTLLRLAEEGKEYFQNINHPQIRTIYPPPAQAVFAIGYLLSPFNLTLWKLMLLLFDLSAMLLLLKILVINGIDKKYSFIYWLNPVLLHEFYNAAHMDLLIFPFLLSAVYYYQKGKDGTGLLFNSLAAAFKIWPVVLIPLLFRNSINNWRKYFTRLTPALLLLVLCFFPLIFTTWDESLGFVKYSGSWVNNEAVFKVIYFAASAVRDLFSISFITTATAARIFTAFIYLLFIIWILRSKIDDNADFNKRALFLVAVLYFISPTQFPWYYTWILPLLVFNPMLSLILYAALLPLYQLNYINPYLVWVEHIPILVLFLLELRGKIWNGWNMKEKFS